MKNTCSIYVLICPIEGEVRYVGKTKHSLKLRLSQHLADNEFYRRNRHTTVKQLWQEFLYHKGLKPIIQLIATVPAQEVDFWEQFYINIYNTDGSEIYNKFFIDRKKYTYICMKNLAKYPRGKQETQILKNT